MTVIEAKRALTEVPRKYRYLTAFGDGDYSANDGTVVDKMLDANVVSSDSSADPTVHYPVIDLDVPVYLIPSSTSGHGHLYINVGMTFEAYKNILVALADAGVVEQGYVDASIRRGRSDVRLPWVVKGKEFE